MAVRRPTKRQIEVLALVRDNDRITTRDVGTKMRFGWHLSDGYDAANAVLGRLAAGGYLARERVPGVGGTRESRWSLTDQGRAVLGG